MCLACPFVNVLCLVSKGRLGFLTQMKEVWYSKPFPRVLNTTNKFKSTRYHKNILEGCPARDAIFLDQNKSKSVFILFSGSRSRNCSHQGGFLELTTWQLIFWKESEVAFTVFHAASSKWCPHEKMFPHSGDRTSPCGHQSQQSEEKIEPNELGTKGHCTLASDSLAIK